MKEPPRHGHASDSTLSPQGPLLCSAFLGFTGPPPLFHGPRDVQSHSFQSSISVKKGADPRIKGPWLRGALPFLSCDHGPAAQWCRSPATAGQSCPMPRRGRAPAGGARLTPAGSVYFARLQFDVFPGRFTWKLDRPGLSVPPPSRGRPLCVPGFGCSREGGPRCRQVAPFTPWSGRVGAGRPLHPWWLVLRTER